MVVATTVDPYAPARDPERCSTKILERDDFDDNSLKQAHKDARIEPGRAGTWTRTLDMHPSRSLHQRQQSVGCRFDLCT